MSQQQDNESLAHRFHMDIFQKGRLEVAEKFLLQILFGEILLFLQSYNAAQIV